MSLPDEADAWEDVFDQTLKWSADTYECLVCVDNIKSPELWLFKVPFRVAKEERRTSPQANIKTVTGKMREPQKNKIPFIR